MRTLIERAEAGFDEGKVIVGGAGFDIVAADHLGHDVAVGELRRLEPPGVDGPNAQEAVDDSCLQARGFHFLDRGEEIVVGSLHYFGVDLHGQGKGGLGFNADAKCLQALGCHLGDIGL